jgi:hypothetical protein
MTVSLRPHFVISIAYFLPLETASFPANWCFCMADFVEGFVERLRGEVFGLQPKAVACLPGGEPQEPPLAMDRWPSSAQLPQDQITNPFA